MPIHSKLTLVTICDNAYVHLLATLLKSIEVNQTSSAQFDLYLVSDDISPKSQQKLQRAINPAVFQVHWLTLEQAIPVGMHLPLDRSAFPPNVYVRLFIPFFIPQWVTRVVYLDVDMIAHQDIAALWTIDLKGKPIGAVKDRAECISSPWGGYTNYQALGLAPETKVFNSGLLVIDPLMWRQQRITQRVVTCIEENVSYAVFADQYGLNVVLANQWTELERGWNCYAEFSDENPYIIHFTGTKPFYRTYCLNKAYQAEFYRYLGMTPWQDYKPVSGWQRQWYRQMHKLQKRWSALEHWFTKEAAGTLRAGESRKIEIENSLSK